MRKRVLILSTIAVSLFVLGGCKKETEVTVQSGSNDTTEIATEATEAPQTQEAPSNEGTYTYEDSSASLEITVSGSAWTGKTEIKSGFGAENDAANAEYQNGIVKGTDLYDDSGYAKIGYVNGSSLTTSMGGNRVTLRK